MSSDSEDFLDQSNMELSFDQSMERNDTLTDEIPPPHANPDSFNFACSPVSSIGSDEDDSSDGNEDNSLTENIVMCLSSSNNSNSSKHNNVPNNVSLGSDAEEYMSIDDIRAQIGDTPPSLCKIRQKKNSLETIFEGVFLETPPKNASKRMCYSNLSKTKLLHDEDTKENVQTN